MILEPVSDPELFDSISQTTRNSRKALLATSLICFTVTWGNLFPEEVSALGLKVTQLERVNLLYVLAMVAAYYTGTFITYCYTDSRLLKVRKRLEKLKMAESASGLRTQMNQMAERVRTQDPQQLMRESPEFFAMISAADDHELAKQAEKASAIRQIVDIQLPVFIGLGAVMVVVQDEVSFRASQ